MASDDFAEGEAEEVTFPTRLTVTAPVLEHIKAFCQAQEPCGPQFRIQLELGDEGLLRLMAAANYLGMDGLLEMAYKEVGGALSNCAFALPTTTFSPRQRHSA